MQAQIHACGSTFCTLRSAVLNSMVVFLFPSLWEGIMFPVCKLVVMSMVVCVLAAHTCIKY